MPFIPDSERTGWTPDPEPCRDPSHSPPTHMVWPCAGTWVCPSCGHETRIFAPRVTCSIEPYEKMETRTNVHIHPSSSVPCSTAPGGYAPPRTVSCSA